MQYGKKQTIDAGPTGNIYTGTNHHYDNIVGQVDSRAMYAHKLRVADCMTIGIVAAQEDTEDEGGLTYLKGNNSGENLYFYWSIGEYDADGNLMFEGTGEVSMNHGQSDRKETTIHMVQAVIHTVYHKAKDSSV